MSRARLSSDALLAFAREHDPSLWETLTRACHDLAHDPTISNPVIVCNWCGGKMNEPGRIPLPAAEAHVALEAYCPNIRKRTLIPGGEVLWEAQVPVTMRYRSGNTLEGAVLAALEAE